MIYIFLTKNSKEKENVIKEKKKKKTSEEFSLSWCFGIVVIATAWAALSRVSRPSASHLQEHQLYANMLCQHGSRSQREKKNVHPSIHTIAFICVCMRRRNDGVVFIIIRKW